MATNDNHRRYQLLLSWMKERDISFSALSEQLGVSSSTARYACQRETCPTNHYKKLVTLGFPKDLLPIPLDKQGGRPKRIPKFPGLMQATA